MACGGGGGGGDGERKGGEGGEEGAVVFGEDGKDGGEGGGKGTGEIFWEGSIDGFVVVQALIVIEGVMVEFCCSIWSLYRNTLVLPSVYIGSISSTRSFATQLVAFQLLNLFNAPRIAPQSMWALISLLQTICEKVNSENGNFRQVCERVEFNYSYSILKVRSTSCHRCHRSKRKVSSV